MIDIQEIELIKFGNGFESGVVMKRVKVVGVEVIWNES